MLKFRVILQYNRDSFSGYVKAKNILEAVSYVLELGYGINEIKAVYNV